MDDREAAIACQTQQLAPQAEQVGLSMQLLSCVTQQVALSNETSRAAKLDN
jgi:hypothetical protein